CWSTARSRGTESRPSGRGPPLETDVAILCRPDDYTRYASRAVALESEAQAWSDEGVSRRWHDGLPRPVRNGYVEGIAAYREGVRRSKLVAVISACIL